MKKNPARNVHLKKGPSKLLEKINSSIDIDSRLYNEDISGSIAHVKMLIKTKIISPSEGKKIITGLNQILKDIEKGKVKFQKRYEDIHMNIEALLHNKIGSLAGKLHTARSRNDQVVTDFKLWIKKHALQIDADCKKFQKALIKVAKKNVFSVMPGYTHLQIAQPVSLAHHCLAYVEMIGRDRARLKDCINRLNENPLGAGALAGTSFPIDRQITTKLLGFAKPTRNSIDSVSDRDFSVEFIFSLSLISVHLSRLAEEIVAVEIPQRKADPIIFNQDEFIKPNSTLEKLASLRAAFKKDGSVTAGNSSGLNDGAAAILVASDQALKDHNLKPMARIVSSAVAGVEPRIMGIGPVYASEKALKRAGLTLADMDVIELNEAFAAQALACIRKMGLADNDPRVNPNGGAIAIGHPLGMSGARLLQTAAIQLQKTQKQYALVTMCIGVGQGYATIIERA